MESWLIQITNYLLAQSWQIAVLTITVALASVLLKNRSAHVRYLLWLIVLAKCLVPPLYWIPIRVLPQEESSEYVIAPQTGERMTANYRVPEVVMPELARPTSAESPVTPSPVITGSPAIYSIRAWLAIGWLAGVVALSLYYLLNALRTQIWLQKQRRPLSSESADNIKSIFRANGIRHMPRIWLLDRINQPFVWGLVRGSIYLPAELADTKQAKFQASLLGHELSHVIRLDAMTNSLQVIAQTVFWFHPFVWWANRKIRAEREKCCDEMTIARFNARPEDYGEAIVETIGAKYEQARSVPSLAVAGRVKNLEERIRTMLRPGRKFYKRPSLIAATVVLLFTVLIVPTALVLTARAEGTKTALQTEEKAGKSLHRAAADGDTARVRLLISKGADVNAKRGGWTPLHCAAWLGQSATTELLLAEGADIEAKNDDDQTPLHFTVRFGQKDLAELLINKGADANARNKDGQTPLHFAARHGKKDMAELFIAKGADIDARQENGRTPLHYAALHGHTDVAELLIARGAYTNAKNNEGFTPLNLAMLNDKPDAVSTLVEKGAQVSDIHLAAYLGDSARVKALIGRGTSLNGKEGVSLTPLHAAVCAGRRDIAQFLIDQGAKVNADESKHAPLSDAAKLGHYDLVELLINRGAHINAKDNSGKTALHYAAQNGHREVVRFLVDKGCGLNMRDNLGNTAVHYAGHSRHGDTIKLLIAKGAEANAVNDAGKTPADIAWDRAKIPSIRELLRNTGATACPYVAAQIGDLAKVREFIAEGFDINAKDTEGNTVLHHAAGKGKEEVVKFLIANGAETNTKNSYDQTPIDSAMKAGKPEIVCILAKGADTPTIHIAACLGDSDKVLGFLERGFDVNVKDRHGRTALYYAAIGGGVETVKLLVDRGADVEARAYDTDCTPLHGAAGGGHTDVVRILINKGADVNARDKWEETVLEYATWSGQRDAVELIIDNGANIHAEDEWGFTALHEAAWSNFREIAEFLIAKGANVNHGDWTPLHSAATMGSEAVAKLLIAKGANVNASQVPAPERWVPLHEAARNGRTEVVKLLLTNGAEVDTEDWSPLQEAAFYGHLDVAELLIANGADINTGRDDYWTPLHSAASNGHVEIVRLLLQKGADPDVNGVLSLAEDRGYTDIVDLLRKHGASKGATAEAAPK